MYFLSLTLTTSPFSARRRGNFLEVSTAIARAGCEPRSNSVRHFFLSLPYTARQVCRLPHRVPFLDEEMYWSPGTVIPFNYLIAPGKDYIKILHPVLYDAVIEEPLTYLSACFWNGMWIHRDRTQFKWVWWFHVKSSLCRTGVWHGCDRQYAHEKFLACKYSLIGMWMQALSTGSRSGLKNKSGLHLNSFKIHWVF